MTDHERLRDLLEQAAPTDPDVTTAVRATRVVRRGRAARRRDRVLVGAAALTVAAAVAVPLSLRGDAGDRGPEVAIPAPATVPDPCPADPVDVGSVPAAALVADDVTWVRACPATAREFQVEALDDLPDGPLVDAEARALVDEVLALPAYTLPDECALMSVAMQPWALVVGGPDGDPVVVGGTLRACGGVSIDGVDRDPAAVIAAFEARVG